MMPFLLHHIGDIGWQCLAEGLDGFASVAHLDIDCGSNKT
jgi:hypothetical protein